MKAKSRAEGIRLGCRIPLQRACRLDFLSQPARCNIKTVRPGQRTVFQEYPREICGVTQWLDHGTISVEDGREIVLSGHAVAEGCPQPMSAEMLDFCDLNHRRDLRSWRAAYQPVPAANYPPVSLLCASAHCLTRRAAFGARWPSMTSPVSIETLASCPL